MRHYDKGVFALKLIHKIENVKNLYLRFRYILLEEKKDRMLGNLVKIKIFAWKTFKVTIVVGIFTVIICHIDCLACSDTLIKYYVDVLIGIAAIETLFIGLYYAGMSSVASSAYANVPYIIRSLLIDDDDSRVFMQFASYASVFSYVFIALNLFFDFTSQFALILSFVGCIFVISNFLVLGKRLFVLLNPKIWTFVINKQIRNIWKSVSKLFVKDSSLELMRACRSRTEEWIQCYESLANLLIDETKNSQQDVRSLCRDILIVLAEYQKAKRTFSTTCSWYGKKHVYKSIEQLDVSDSNLFVNLKYQRPYEETDLYWFESRLEKVLLRGYKFLVKHKSSAEYLWIVSESLDYVTNLAENGDVKRAQHFVDDLWNYRPEVFEERTHAVSFVENIFRLETNLLVVLAKKDGRNVLDGKIASLKINSETEIYKGQYDYSQISILEHVLNQIKIERKIYRKSITPKWYISEYLSQHEALKMDEFLSLLTIENAARFEKRVGDYSKDAFVKSIILKCIEEYWGRFDYLFERIENMLASLKQGIKNPFPLFENKKWAVFAETLEKHKKFVVDHEASILLIISAEPREKSFPDYAGALRYDLGEQCLNKALTNDFSNVEVPFEEYVKGTFIQVAMAQSVSEQKTMFDSAIIVSSGVIICSEFYGRNELRSFVGRVWENILKVWLDNNGSNLFFNNIRLLPLNINSSYLEKFNRLIENLLQSVEYGTEIEERTFSVKEKITAKHSSPIIRVLVQEMRSSKYHEFNDFGLTFISSILMNYGALSDVNFDYRCKYLKQKFDEEKDGSAKK